LTPIGFYLSEVILLCDVNEEIKREARRHGIYHRLWELEMELKKDGKKPPKTFEELIDRVVT